MFSSFVLDGFLRVIWVNLQTRRCVFHWEFWCFRHTLPTHETFLWSLGVLWSFSNCLQTMHKNVKSYFLRKKKGYSITKTGLYNFDPLKPHFYIVKLGFIGVYIIFLISAQNIDCGYLLEPPHRGSSNEYPQSMFWAEIWKISEFFIWKFSCFCGNFFSIFE